MTFKKYPVGKYTPPLCSPVYTKQTVWNVGMLCLLFLIMFFYGLEMPKAARAESRDQHGGRERPLYSNDRLGEAGIPTQSRYRGLGDNDESSESDPCGLNSVVCPEEKPKVVKTFQAIRTYYTRKSSCHNPKGNKCLTANGEDTTEGRTVACPYSLKLGTRVTLSDEPDHVYTCTDRYARFLDGKRGLPTVDVFVEDAHAGTVPAHKIVTVTVL